MKDPRYQLVLLRNFVKCLHHQSRNNSSTSLSWQIHNYGGPESLTLSKTKKLPTIKNPNEVLVEVYAVSVNPIDARMSEGYGASLLNVLRQIKYSLSSSSELPLTLGRDFSGVVRATGQRVNHFKVGDEVWGALGSQRQGSHASYTIAGADEISLKPVSLSHIEAASIPYVARTTLSALCLFGHLQERSAVGKRVLIIGGSGGIGTFAIQLTKAWGMHVTTVCSSDAVDLVMSLGADVVLDYKTCNIADELQNIGSFDYVLDPIGGEATSYAQDRVTPGGQGMYITLVSPLLSDSDTYGVPVGLARSAAEFGCSFVTGLQKQVNYRWAYFVPDGKSLQRIAKMVDEGKIRPVVDEVLTMDKLPEAYKKVGERHGRGKTVINVKDFSDATEQEHAAQSS